MKFIKLLKTIKRLEDRVKELEELIVENQKATTKMIQQHTKMLEWVYETDKEISKLRKEKVKNEIN